MGIYLFKLPDVGEGVTEAEVVVWHVKPNDVIAEDDMLADVMTDKATVEMTSPVSGTVKFVNGEVGDMIPVGATLVEIEVEGDVEETSLPSSKELVQQPKKVGHISEATSEVSPPGENR